jgi:hypothetical protein
MLEAIRAGWPVTSLIPIFFAGFANNFAFLSFFGGGTIFAIYSPAFGNA